jgi:hypothetical protein
MSTVRQIAASKKSRFRTDPNSVGKFTIKPRDTRMFMRWLSSDIPQIIEATICKYALCLRVLVAGLNGCYN